MSAFVYLSIAIVEHSLRLLLAARLSGKILTTLTTITLGLL